MNITLKNKVAVIACFAIVAPSLVLPARTSQLSFVSLRAQTIQKKDTTTKSKSGKNALIKNENTNDGIPAKSDYPKKPYTVQDLLDFLGNKKIGLEYRYDAMQLAGQLPRNDYIRFLKSAIEVNNGEFAVDSILRLFELDEQSMPSSINKLVLSLPEYGQRKVLFRFIKGISKNLL